MSDILKAKGKLKIIGDNNVMHTIQSRIENWVQY